MKRSNVVRIGVPRETFPGERRVALTPGVLSSLTAVGVQIRVEEGAGVAAGFPDEAFRDQGATLVGSRAEVFRAELVLQVRTLGANPEKGQEDLDLLRKGQVLVGLADPLVAAKELEHLAARGVTLFALELLPRITRAQSMDVLSSMATVAGYKAVVLAAERLPKMFPMMTTAAGTLAPARVLVVGAGVAGLQAIATARRLGAVVTAYDVRPEVREEVESLGARFAELELETTESQDERGYARELGEAFYRKQRERMSDLVRQSDVVVTTAAVPGKRAPRIIDASMVEAMRPGSVIVDLAAASGGNCELAKADEVVDRRGVLIFGPTNLPSTVAHHASQMFARNLAAFVSNLVTDGELRIQADDEVLRETLVLREGRLVHARLGEVVDDRSAAT